MKSDQAYVFGFGSNTDKYFTHAHPRHKHARYTLPGGSPARGGSA